MSAKSTKQAKKLSIPREMPEIQQAYQQLCANAGQVQYQIKIHAKELERINEQLQSVNNEAAARQQLDKESASTQQTTIDTDNQQSQAV